MKKIMKSVLFALAVVFTAVQVNAQTIDDGLRHLNAERYIQAGETFNAVANANPTAENYFQLGRYYLSTPDAINNLDKAEVAFTKGNSFDKKGDIYNQVGLATIIRAKGDFGGAKLLFDDLIKKGRNKNSELLYRIAESYTYEFLPESNDPAEAVMLIDNALDIRKVDNPMYHIVRAKAFLIQNEGGDLMNSLQNAERMGVKDMASIYSTMARVWLQGKNYREADASIKKSIAADIEHAPAYYYLSSLNQTYQKWDQAAEAAAKYLKYGDGDCGAKLRYTKLAFTAKDFDNVLSKIKEIESCNDDPIVHRLSGISKFEQGNLTEAVADLKKYIGVADKSEIFGLDYGFIGRAYLAMDDEATMEANDALAIENIDKAIALNDTTFDYYAELARYFQEKKDYDKAIVYNKKTIANKKAPDGGDYWNLGYLQYIVKDYVAADSTFDKVCVAYGDTWAPPYLMSARSKAYINKEDTTFVAADRYAKYVTLIAEDQKVANASTLAEAYKYLAGKEFAVNKDVVKATEYIDELLKFDPTNQSAIDLKNSINGVVPEEELMEEEGNEDLETGGR